MAGLCVPPDTDRLPGRVAPGRVRGGPWEQPEGGQGALSSLPASEPEAPAASTAAKGPAPRRQQREPFPASKHVLVCVQVQEVI